MVSWQSFMSLHLKLLDIDHPLTFEESKLRQIEAHALIYLSVILPVCNFFLHSLTVFFFVLHLDPAAHIPFSFPNVIYFSARCKICFWVSLSP